MFLQRDSLCRRMRHLKDVLAATIASHLSRSATDSKPNATSGEEDVKSVVKSRGREATKVKQEPG